VHWIPRNAAGCCTTGYQIREEFWNWVHQKSPFHQLLCQMTILYRRFTSYILPKEHDTSDFTWALIKTQNLWKHTCGIKQPCTQRLFTKCQWTGMRWASYTNCVSSLLLHIPSQQHGYRTPSSRRSTNCQPRQFWTKWVTTMYYHERWFFTMLLWRSWSMSLTTWDGSATNPEPTAPYASKDTARTHRGDPHMPIPALGWNSATGSIQYPPMPMGSWQMDVLTQMNSKRLPHKNLLQCLDDLTNPHEGRIHNGSDWRLRSLALPTGTNQCLPHVSPSHYTDGNHRSHRPAHPSTRVEYPQPSPSNWTRLNKSIYPYMATHLQPNGKNMELLD